MEVEECKTLYASIRDSGMDKKRALDILIANTRCSIGLCSKRCPWYGTNDCENTAITTELLIEAINTLGEED